MTGTPPVSSVETIFLGWDGPALPKAAGIMAEAYAGPGDMDLRGAVVVTPAARAGRRLLELLLEEAEGRGVGLTPPRSVTMGHFPELLYRPSGPLADGTVTRHAFAQALKGTDPDVLRRVFPGLSPDFTGWLALAGIVEKLHREVGAGGLAFTDVKRVLEEGFPYDDSDRWGVLAGIQASYLRALERSGLRDRDRERKSAWREGRLTSPGEIWMVGVVELPSLIRRMVEALPGPVRALVHAPVEVKDRFDALGCFIPEAWKGVSIPLEDDQIRVVQRPRDQATAVTDVLRGFQGRFSAEEVVVGVPDSELVPILERALSGVDVPHRFAGGTPLKETGPFRLLQVLAEYLNGKPFHAFASLIRHPDLHGAVEAGVMAGDGESVVTGGGENVVTGRGESVVADDREVTGALTIVDRFQAEHLQDSVGGGLPGEDRDARRVRRLIRGLHRTLGLDAFRGTRAISKWMPDILEVLVGVYGGEPLDRRNPSVRHVVEALSCIKTAATRLAVLPGALDVQVEASEALSALLEEVRGPDTNIPPDPEEHAVEFLGWLELPLDDAPAVILTGVNDRIFPEAVGADAFLPGALRTRLGIPDDASRYGRDAYLLSALLRSREEVHLAAGRASLKGDPLRPSRLLFAVEPEVVARRILRYLGDGDEVPAPGPRTDPREARGLAAEAELRTESRFHSPPQDPIPALASLPTIRVTDFGRYLRDPYRYALERVLSLDTLDDGGREMDGGAFGNLAHEVLERFGRSEEVTSAEAGVIGKKLNQILDRGVRDRFGSRPVPAVRVQAEQLRARLQRFARWQADWIGKGWKVMAVERQPEPGVPFSVDGEEVLLRGKIDRIDHHPGTGEWAIFDYKTSDKGRGPEETHRKGRGANKEWVDLQLPLYRFLLPGIPKEDGTPLIPEAAWKRVILGYILLPRELDRVGASLASWTEGDLSAAHETAQRVVRELRSQPFRYDPGTRTFQDDPLNAILGRLELPRADDEGGGGGGG